MTGHPPTHPPIDSEIAKAMAEQHLSPASMRPADLADRRREAVADPAALTRGGALTVTEIELTGPGAGPHPVVTRIERAAGPDAPAADAPRPGLVFLHGGGLVMGSRHNVDSAILDAAELGVIVLSVEYRLAPEHPYPAGLDDCYHAWCAVTADAARMGLDPRRLAIAGSSAGGGLAAAVCLRLRAEGGPLPCAQILYWPMLDDRELTPSSTMLDGHGRWDRTANRTAWDAYLGNRRGAPDVPAEAAPARATDLTGLPPTFLDLGDVETFRDEDLDFAARLSQAGVPVELHLWPGGVHGFVGIAPDAALSRAALAARRDYLVRNLLDRDSTARP